MSEAPVSGIHASESYEATNMATVAMKDIDYSGYAGILLFLLLSSFGVSIAVCLASYWKVKTLGNDGSVDYTVLFYHRSLKVQAVNIGNGGGDPVDLLGVNYATCIAESEQQGPSYAGYPLYATCVACQKYANKTAALGAFCIAWYALAVVICILLSYGENFLRSYFCLGHVRAIISLALATIPPAAAFIVLISQSYDSDKVCASTFVQSVLVPANYNTKIPPPTFMGMYVLAPNFVSNGWTPLEKAVDDNATNEVSGLGFGGLSIYFFVGGIAFWYYFLKFMGYCLGCKQTSPPRPSYDD